ncbi:molybdopterin-binding protein, partial [Staphylococcus epidermidis]
YTEVEVYEKPSIAVIATGSELLDVSDELQPGKIRNSNGPMIKALAEQLGIHVGSYQIQQDDLQSSIEVVKHAMEQHDMVITTGGVS